MKKSAFIIAAFILAACSGVVENPVGNPAASEAPDNPQTLADLSRSLFLGEPGFCTVRAGFASTRSHLRPSADRNSVKVYWEAGDTFEMVNIKTGAYAPFSTTQSGECVEFTSYYYVSAAELYSFHPSLDKRGTYGPDIIVGFNIPANQTAVAGGLEDGLNISYAYSSSMDEDLHFRNIPSLLRFRLSGSVVPEVTSVTVKGSSAVAGDFTMLPSNGELEYFGRQFGGGAASKTVTLSGSFVPGEDYYIAMVPKSQSIQLIFSDAAGNTTTKVSSKEIPFTQGKVTDIGTIDIGDSLEDAKPLDPFLYMSASSGYTPVSIAVIPEGFKSDQMNDYTLLACSAIDAIMDTEPFKTYRNYFNAWILYANSRESGASVTDGNGTITELHNTAFGASWAAESYDDMRADDTEIFDFVRNNCPDIVNGIHSLEEVPILLLINDERYGGMCWSYSSGRAYAMVPYTARGGKMRWSFPDYVAKSDSDPSLGYRPVPQSEKDELGSSTGDWRNIAIHEFAGHCFSRLADEYWSLSYYPEGSSVSRHSWSVPFGLNISATYNNSPWKETLLDNLDYLVSLNSLYSRIGVFQGGDISLYNRWRSEKISCMIDNRAYFSTWQRILAVKRIMSLAGAPFDLNDFFARDVPTDPVRDVAASPVIGDTDLEDIKLMPPLPPPLLID